MEASSGGVPISEKEVEMTELMKQDVSSKSVARAKKIAMAVFLLTIVIMIAGTVASYSSGGGQLILVAWLVLTPIVATGMSWQAYTWVILKMETKPATKQTNKYYWQKKHIK